jgi:tRNA pseudouridine32 synthase/23S rRNA pseudouridine746 synthase
MARPLVMAEPLDPTWIVHHGDDLIALNKPSGLLCQPGLGPALADSLITRVQHHWPQAQLVHRLDRDTSGLILVALTPELHRALSRLFAERQVLKRYVADVHGVPLEAQGLIELPIAKRQHRPPLYGVDSAGKPCITGWRLLEVIRPTGQNSALSSGKEYTPSHSSVKSLPNNPALGLPEFVSSVARKR